MRALVTGAAGFLGAYTCKRLVADGHVVTGVDTVNPSEAWRLDALGLRYAKTFAYRWGAAEDIRETKAEWVVHCASATDVGNSKDNPHQSVSRSVWPTVSVLEAARHSPVLERFVQISSHSAYGPQQVQPIPEDSVLRPGTLYGAIKAFQEQVAMSYHRSFEMPVSVIRSATLYGPHIRAGALVRVFLERAARDETITVSGAGTQSRDLTHVDSTVEGIVLALERDVAIGQIFNVGSGEDIAIVDLAQRAIQIMGAGRVEHGPERFGEEGRLALDMSKAVELLGYRPALTVDEGLRQTADWVGGTL